MSTTGSRHAERIDVPKASPYFPFFNNQKLIYWPKQLYVREKEKPQVKCFELSDGELCSPEEKKVKEVSVSENSLLLDSSSDKILDASKWALHIYWYLLFVITMDDDDNGGDNGLLIEIVMMKLAIDGTGGGDEKWWWEYLFIY